MVVACYNETAVLERNVALILKVLSMTKLDYEMIFVDDCSSDETVDIIKGLIKDRPHLKLIRHETNKGRGRTVADGIKQAEGKVVGFLDIDLSTPPWYIPLFVSAIEEGTDVAVAHRVYKLNWKILHRWALSRGYNLLVRLFLQVPMIDTEAGFKFFNREKILPILDRIEDEHWFWDTEITVLSYLSGLSIRELPTVYIRYPELRSKVKIVQDVMRYIKNLFRFRRKIRNLPRRIVNA